MLVLSSLLALLREHDLVLLVTHGTDILLVNPEGLFDLLLVPGIGLLVHLPVCIVYSATLQQLSHVRERLAFHHRVVYAVHGRTHLFQTSGHVAKLLPVEIDVVFGIKSVLGVLSHLGHGDLHASAPLQTQEFQDEHVHEIDGLHDYNIVIRLGGRWGCRSWRDS